VIHFLRNFSIRGKLMFIIMATVAATILLGGGALVARYATAAWGKEADRLTTLGKAVSSNIAAAVAFDEPVSAEETLSAFTVDTSILAAHVYNGKGEPFARYAAPGTTPPTAPAVRTAPAWSSSGDLLRDDVMVVSGPILLDGERIGTIRIDADLRQIRAAFWADVGLLSLIFLMAGLVALILSSILQNIVSEPITRLAQATRDITRTGNYKLRVDKVGDDEVGALIDGFNDMLRQIAIRDDRLETRRSQLEVAANAIESTSDAIMITDKELKIVSVNRAFTSMTRYAEDEVVGRTPQFLLSAKMEPDLLARLLDQVAATGHWQGEIVARRRDGEEFPQRTGIGHVVDGAGESSHYVFVSSDISHYKQYEANLEYLAHHDVLTKLPNRRRFREQLGEAIARANRRQERIAVLFIDLDHFKAINDSLGHAVGDQLLVEAAARIRNCLRNSDIVARQGGDEFTVLLDNVGSRQDAGQVAEKIVEQIARPFHLAEKDRAVSASIGIACYPEDGTDEVTLMKNADMAMYEAKMAGRNRYRHVSSGEDKSVSDSAI
jgi:diguanylate cyclase (GGDEF)-like protein/PAS domain S-box-containing protein